MDFELRSDHVCGVEKSDDDSGEGVLPCMRDDAWAETAAIDGEDAEQGSVGSDGDHAADAFVSVCGAEEERRRECADDKFGPRATDGERRELLEEVAAEDELFDNAGSDAEYEPDDGLGNGLRRDGSDDLLRGHEVKEAQQEAEGAEDEHGEDPEDDGDGEVKGPLARGIAARAEKLAQRRATNVDAPQSKERESELPNDGEDVLADTCAVDDGKVVSIDAAESGDAYDDGGNECGVPPGSNRPGARGPFKLGKIGWNWNCIL